MSNALIIVAWTETATEIVRHRRLDLGERPITREVTIGKSALWANEGTPEDLAKAEAYAAHEGYQVFTYPVGTEDARRRAERSVVRQARAA